MTKEITKARILQEIQDKFNLRELEPEIFAFSERVVPVYNIEQHLNHWWNRYAPKSITGTGGYVFFTVPDNERWHLRAYDVVFMGINTCTVAGVYLQRTNRNPTDAFIYLDLKAAQTVSYHVSLETLVCMGPGDVLYINVDGFTSAQTLRLYLDYLVEEIR